MDYLFRNNCSPAEVLTYLIVPRVTIETGRRNRGCRCKSYMIHKGHSQVVSFGVQVTLGAKLEIVYWKT